MSAVSTRMYVVASIIVLSGFILLLRLFYMQVIDDQYKLYANDNVLRHVTVYPARGLLNDRNDELMVYNESAYDLMVIPRKVKSMDTLRFCNLVGIGIEEFRSRILDARKFSYYKSSAFEKQIAATASALIREKLYLYKGFYLQPRTLRKYARPSAAHVLGYVSEVNERTIAENPYYRSGDYIGKSGVEKSYETQLRGKKGLKVLMVDVHNRIVGSFEEGNFDTLAEPGNNMTITIDAELQLYGEKLLQNKLGSIVAIEPGSGEILALVTSPGYDPNLLVGRQRSKEYAKLAKDTLKPLYNRAIMADQYPPGSTFKTINALIALQENVVREETYYGCQGGYHAGGLTVGCHRHSSPLNLPNSIGQSCNAYYCRVFRSIIDKYPTTAEGFRVWEKHVRSFGLGQLLGTDLSNELAGLVPTVEYYDRYHGEGRWKSLTVISLAIGQGELGVTPLQMANLAAIIGNKGYYFTPHIVRTIEGHDEFRSMFNKKIYTTISRKHFDIVIEGMARAVESGTARLSKIDSIAFCGKTGTAQNPHGEDHSIFMAFAPRDNPQIAIAVYVENAGGGSKYAAPVPSLMIEKYLADSISRPRIEERIMNTNLVDPAKE